MLADIVVDANVLMHAQNPVSGRMSASLKLANVLRDGLTILCVDDGFSIEEAANRSFIGSEYLKHLRFGTVGYGLVVHLALSKRILTVSHAVPTPTRRAIQRQIPKGPDRIYVQVAMNTTEKVLVSHDFNDIPDTVRTRLGKNFSVKILAAERAVYALCPPEPAPPAT